MNDSPEEAICICYRVTDPTVTPLPTSWVEFCTVCKQAVWRAEGTPREARNVCWECAPSEDLEVHISPRQRELFHQNGWSDEAIEAKRLEAEMKLLYGRRK